MLKYRNGRWAKCFLVIVCIKDTKADMLILVFKSSGGNHLPVCVCVLKYYCLWHQSLSTFKTPADENRGCD